MALEVQDAVATVTLHNEGPPIAPALLGKVFEYGVSDAAEGDAPAGEHRGQGLFVAKTYMAKMGGTISAQNVQGGVQFVLALQLAPLPRSDERK